MRLKVVSDSLSGHAVRVWIDDAERDDVVRVELAVDASENTWARVTFIADVLDVDVDAEDDPK